MYSVSRLTETRYQAPRTLVSRMPLRTPAVAAIEAAPGLVRLTVPDSTISTPRFAQHFDGTAVDLLPRSLLLFFRTNFPKLVLRVSQMSRREGDGFAEQQTVPSDSQRFSFDEPYPVSGRRAGALLCCFWNETDKRKAY